MLEHDNESKDRPFSWINDEWRIGGIPHEESDPEALNGDGASGTRELIRRGIYIRLRYELKRTQDIPPENDYECYTDDPEGKIGVCAGVVHSMPFVR